MDPVLTLTMNPTVDTTVEVDRVEEGVKLRTSPPRRDAGGGGVNVSRALERMGAEAPALFPCGGPVGRMLVSLLEDEDVAARSVPVEGDTRENVTVREREGEGQYRFVMPGPELVEEEWRSVLQRLEAADPRPRWLVASGSLPPGVPTDLYARVARWSREAEVELVLDTSGEPLAAALEEGVHLVKPNARELGEATGREIRDEGDQEAAVRKILDAGGARVVVLSLGPSGVLLMDREGRTQRIRSPSVRPRSRVGAGDCTVAGIVVGLARGEALSAAVRRGVAAGAAAVTTPGTELLHAEDVEPLLERLREG